MTQSAPYLRYAVVSGICLTAHNAIMIVADRFGQTPLVGIGASFSLVSVVGYLLHSRYSFAAPSDWKGFSRYVFGMAGNLPLSLALIWLFSTALAWPMPVASPTASCCLIVVNFVVGRWAILGRAGRAAAAS